MREVQQLMDELRLVARQLLLGERHGEQVRPTALVLSGLRRLNGPAGDWESLSWKSRQYFFGAMRQAMRRALLDYARHRAAQRRPQLDFVEPEGLDFLDLPAVADERPERIQALDEALAWLERSHPALAEIVEYRYFAGLTIPEVSRVLETSEKTVQRRWVEARLLLHRHVLDSLNETATTSPGTS